MAGLAPDAGQYRTGAVYIRGATFTPPPAGAVPALVAEWLAWLVDTGQVYEPLIRLALAHHGFEALHPFSDGNGRTERLLLNLGLLAEGYPPALLLRQWRGAYLRALDAAGQEHYRPLLNLVGRVVEGGLDHYLAACLVEPEEAYQPLAALARADALSPDYLGWLVRQGRLAAVKRGGRWYSTPEALAQYQAEVATGRYPAGRPPSAPPPS